MGAGRMVAAGLVAASLAVPAQRRSLEEIARPFTSTREWLKSAGRGTATEAPDP